MRLLLRSINIKVLIASGLFIFLWGILPTAEAASPDDIPLPKRVESLHNQAEVTLLDTIPKNNIGKHMLNPDAPNPFDLKMPSVLQDEIEYDSETNSYNFINQLDEEFRRYTPQMTFSEYLEYRKKQQELDYLNKIAGNTAASGLSLNPMEEIDVTKNLADRLFGGSEINIQPRGSIDVSLGYEYQNVENPILLERQQRYGGLDFDMPIQLDVTGSVGDKLNLNFNWNNKSTFNFDQNLKIGYDTDNFSEDEIIKTIDAGYVSLPLNSQLIQGSQNLFGVKIGTQFGRLKLTTILSQQNSEQKDLNLEGGGQLQEFEVTVDSYDENRHFFLSHYFRDHFEESLEQLPQIRSLYKITKVEAWITNDRNQVEDARDILSVADLGETEQIFNQNPNLQNPPAPVNPDILGIGLPDNTSNGIYASITSSNSIRSLDRAVAVLNNQLQLEQGRDFEKVGARLLRSSEFTFHPDLGYISLNTAIRPDQVIAVSYEYEYNGKKYQVGEFSTDLPLNPDTTTVLFTKLLKGTTQRIDLPIWDLMMKNIYSIGAYQVSQEDFQLDIFYEDPGKSQKRYLPADGFENLPLLNIFNLDQLTTTGDPQPGGDGRFDFVNGVTFNLATGRMMFPTLEPFGSRLAEDLQDPDLIDEFVYQELYDSTIVIAREFVEKNRFLIKGRYKASSTDEYNLNSYNVPRGSVNVYAGSQELIEGVDYEVNYGLGTVRIINPAYMGPGVNVRVSYEDQGLFNLNRKNMVGLRADYTFSDELNLGATFMQLWERPYTQKVNFGEDPINNRMIGLDLTLSKQAPWLTRALDKLPLIRTKEPSTVDLTLEGAWLKPGHSKAIDVDSTGGTAYIDDFEGSSTGIDLRLPIQDWVHSSIPQNDLNNNNPKYPESALNNSLLTGVNRAHISWYRVESNYASNADPYTRAIQLNDVFPGRQVEFEFASNYLTFDITFDPSRRGPYNFDVPSGTQYSEGLDPDGQLNAPKTRWAGIQRAIQRNDFQAANVEYIEMWVLNPFMQRADGSQLADGGKLYINLGNVSEDIMKDSRMMFENGLPVPGSNNPLDTTNIGVVPRVRNLTRSFDPDANNRALQDVGYDGLDDVSEKIFFADYIQSIQSLNAQARQQIENDPSNDNYVSFRSAEFPDDFDPIERYALANMPQGNSKTSDGTQLESNTNQPDNEDINDDNTLNEIESYFEYEIPIEYDPATNGIKQIDFITDTINSSAGVWYRIKVPIDEYERKVGGINDFRSIRFIRLYMDGFESKATFRFAKFELINNTWRKYTKSLSPASIGEPNPISDNVEFDVNVVNIEENSGKFPFPYTIPPGVVREISYGTVNSLARNEQSIAMNVCNLPYGEAAAIYKLIGRNDFRDFERLKLFVHAEGKDGDNLNDDDLSIFLRIGADFTNNYYEYEIPLVLSQVGPSTGTLAYKEEVWKKINEFDFPLDLLKDTKIRRNAEGASEIIAYEVEDPDKPRNKVRVVGNPTLGDPKSIMIGVRNTAEDRLDKCGEIWINELRLQGLDEEGGMAALARLDVQLADLGRINLASNFSTIGWGALDQKLVQRQKEQNFDYNISANIELSKLLPSNWNLSVPLFTQYSNEISTPEYDPYDNDLTLDEKLESVPQNERDSVRDQAITREVRKTVSLNNVRVLRDADSKKPMPWNIENFSVSYSKSTSIYSDPITEEDRVDQEQGALDYNFSAQPLYITPFKNVISNDKFLKFLTEFNFNPIPSNFSFRNEMNRFQNKTVYRFMEANFSDWYTKRFTWDRNYNLAWNLTRSLRINYDALHNAIVDELPVLDENRNPYSADEIRDTLFNNLSQLGRPKNYAHNLNITFTLPFKHFPFLDFIDIGTQLNTSYSWSAAALNAQEYGNIIQNSQARTANIKLDMVKLYNKVGYLRKINDYKLGEKPSSDPRSRTRPGNAPSRSRNPGNNGEGDEKEKKNHVPGLAEAALIRPFMSLRNVNITYANTVSSIVPGFTPQPKFFGLDESWTSPGLGYVFGIQPTDNWLDDLVSGGNNFITESTALNQEVVRNNSERIDASIEIEPFREFKITLNANKNYVKNNYEFFKIQQFGGEFEHLSPRDIGSYNISFFSLNTFVQTDTSYIQDLFATFEDNRTVISDRLGDGTPHDVDGDEYDKGYGRYQSDVIIPAFLAAYTDKSPSQIALNFLDIAPKINWDLQYNGLSKLPFLSEVFSNFTVRHGYASNLNVNSFRTDRDYNEDPDLNFNPLTSNYYSTYEIPDVIISESFSPLVGIQIQTKNNLDFSIDYNRNRNLGLSLTNYQVNENNASDIVVGFGTTFKNVYIPLLHKKDGGKKRTARPEPGTVQSGDNASKRETEAGNDILVKVDFSYGNTISVIHLFDSEVQPQVSSGSKNISLRPTVDYQLSDKLTIRLYGEYDKTIPYTSNSYPITRFKAGTTVRYKLN
ncbi:T9SS outer membrane translocon Sov/SprA [Membranihabitans marinus]|uniref:T9SS outer membrane translocon Sov/SprA n=1 Tax=Membranihabitans marinus TaxID=1227546 RepID=UPI001F38A519|nr:cell surface protein SprA [Membranihabitans marinus]